MRRDDDFEPKVGRIGDRGGDAAGKIRSFSSEVTSAARKAGLGSIDLGPRRGVRSFGRGRSISRAQGQRQVVVKARIIRHRGSRFRAASLGTHLYYLRRGGTGRDGRPGEAFDRDGVADHEGFAKRAEPDRHHFRFIVSPEDAAQLADLRATTRDLVDQMEKDLGTHLDWIAVDHWNTDNPHVHLLVRGVADDGRDLVIDRDYMAHGLRERAKQLVTQELGPRSALEIAAAADHEVEAERWTSLDRRLRDRIEPDSGRIDLRPADRGGSEDRRRLVGRAQVLQRYGLAEEVAPGRWRLAENLEVRLREIALRGDIIKTLHQVQGGGDRDPASMVIEGDRLEAPVTGRMAGRGLHDELNGQAYVIVDGVDGRLHHFRFGDLAASGDTPVGGLVEIRSTLDADGVSSLSLLHRSDLSIAAQVSAKGATWLDRQLVVAEPTALAQHGFGAEVRDALDRRRDHLAAAGLGETRDGKFQPARKLIAKLRDVELDQVKAKLAAGGKGVVTAGEGDLVSGVYARRLDLASGRFAMIDDGLGFQLVPWTRSLESRLGQEVSGTITNSGVDWSFGKKRGLGL
jgi:type IV secretory pathway VirD2 relaxase